MRNLAEFGFKFKGSRDYVHGTDIYKAFSGYYQDNTDSSPKSVQLSFHGISHKNLELVSECDDELIKVLISVTNKDGGKQKYYLREIKAAPSSRYPYDEDAVVDGWEMSDNGLAAVLNSPKSEFSVIESLVALNKAFLTKLHNPNGKWLFARLKVTGLLPSKCSSMQLSTTSSSNLRLVRSKIEIDGEPFGEIYFSLT